MTKFRNGKPSIIVISSDYPSKTKIYGDVFVHTRLKIYMKTLNVKVVGYNSTMGENRVYEYEGIPVHIHSDLKNFQDQIIEEDPDLVIGHLIQHHYMDFILSLHKPLLIFMHGFEATSWRNRLMNYNAPGSWPYLLEYMMSNNRQIKKLKSFIREANSRNDVQFIFVSKWLQKTTQKDTGMVLKNAVIIPNGIDTDLFEFKEKDPELRKKILLIRSFKARNYANDISIDAIKILSTKEFFQNLEFTIYGEGYLFHKLTDSIKDFPNVKLHNFFIENDQIPSIHRDHGIFLCPSRLDTQGVSMCESMSSGLVPIASNIGGIPEYATHNISSFLANTAKEVAASIEHLYLNPTVFLEMSRNARQRILHRCSLKNTVQEELNVIKSLITPGDKTDTVYRQCTQCVLDTNDESTLTFDDEGVCQYCREYQIQEKRYVKTGNEGREKLDLIVNKVKQAGIGKPYDCIIGLSGGVDSTYLALIAKRLGLRPLAVHFDNGWNSELAIGNIEGIVKKLELDLLTYVIDWEEFRDLQLAFLRASVVDIEILTDHSIMASLYKIALDKKIKYILSGSNVVTEAVLPVSWIHNKRDHVHIRAINELFGVRPIRNFPLIDSWMRLRLLWNEVNSVDLLNYLPYNKEQAKVEIASVLGWRDYGGKHYESIFTRFYQGFILPAKFGIDKRKAHLSNLICSNQLTKSEALMELKKPNYEEAIRRADYEFVLKKLGLSEEEFQHIMKLPIKKHTDYPVGTGLFDRIPAIKLLKPFWTIFQKTQSGNDNHY